MTKLLRLCGRRLHFLKIIRISKRDIIWYRILKRISMSREFRSEYLQIRVISRRYQSSILPISKWCEDWLRDDYEQIARYAPNGIEKENFPHHKREMNGKIRILIEGDCGVEYKKC